MPDSRDLRTVLPALMAVQAVLGLVLHDQYRDIEWVAATWYGNDWVTLVLAVPLLLRVSTRSVGGSVRALATRLGITAYAVYNYGFYLFGAALNVFFPLYVICLVV